MMKERILLCLCFLWSVLFALPVAWINEIHYDNAGTDANEFVEVIVKDPETVYLGDLVLYMYNGYDGTIYCLDAIEEFEIGERSGAYQVYVWYQRGIQNDTEGMILVFKDTLVDIIAYEGSFTGCHAPASGCVFPDIGVSETSSGPDTCSVHLTGMPGAPWEYGTATPGEINTAQILAETATPLELLSFTAFSGEAGIVLQWQTASETEVSVFHLYRNAVHLAYVQANGTSSYTTLYRYVDTDDFESSAVYTLSEITLSGKESILDTICVIGKSRADIDIGDPYPNPGNPGCCLPIRSSRQTQMTLSLYDLQGRLIRPLFKGLVDPGAHDIPIDMAAFPSGYYVLSCVTTTGHYTKRFNVIK